MMAIERAIDAIAAHLGLDPLDVRRVNLYGPGRDDALSPDRRGQCRAADHRRSGPERWTLCRAARQVDAFNAGHKVLKKGLALTPVKFGISFTTTHLNQAGALVLVYADGSIHLNHGGTEMGQGLMIKVAQVVADVFAVPIDTVKVSATRTDKVPNTSATAASSGSDLNGMAARNAAMTIRQRLDAFAAAKPGSEAGRSPSSAAAPHLARVSLAATGYYATPKIAYDRASHRGRPSSITPMAPRSARS